MTTVGLNGYLSRRLRMMFNYSHGEVENSLADGEMDIFQARLQVDF